MDPTARGALTATSRSPIPISGFPIPDSDHSDGVDDQEVAARLGCRGVAALPLSNSYVGPARRQGLLLGFACAAPQRLLQATRILGDVLTVTA